MGATAIHTEGLTKRYGDVAALDHLDLEVAPGRGRRLPRAQRRRQDHDDPPAARADPPDRGARPRSSAWTASASPSRPTAVWPSWPERRTCGRRSPAPRPSICSGASTVSVDEAYRDELIARFDLDPDKKVRAYSKGNRQKVILIGALMVRPDLLVLDEPTSGLDPLMEQAFRHCIREARDRGQTVFLSSHILSEVEALCDRVGILRAGKLVEMGTLAEMRHLVRADRGGDLRRSGPRPVRGPRGELGRRSTGGSSAATCAAPIEPLLKVLATAGVTELLSREPSLEELFLAQYGERRPRRRRPGGRESPVQAPPRWRDRPATVVAG